MGIFGEGEERFMNPGNILMDEEDYQEDGEGSRELYNVAMR